MNTKRPSRATRVIPEERMAEERTPLLREHETAHTVTRRLILGLPP
jgi:hypothetical protein